METLRIQTPIITPLPRKDLFWLQEGVALANGHVSLQWSRPTESFEDISSDTQSAHLPKNLHKEARGVVQSPHEVFALCEGCEMAPHLMELSSSVERATPHPLLGSKTLLGSRQPGKSPSTQWEANSASYWKLSRAAELKSLPPAISKIVLSGHKKQLEQEAFISHEACTPPEAVRCLDRQHWHQSSAQSIRLNVVDIPRHGLLLSDLGVKQSYPDEQMCNLDASLLKILLDAWRQALSLRTPSRPTVLCLKEGVCCRTVLTIPAIPVPPHSDRAIVQQSLDPSLSGVSSTITIPCANIVPHAGSCKGALEGVSSGCSCPTCPDSSSLCVTSRGMQQRRKNNNSDSSTIPQKRQKMLKAKREQRQKTEKRVHTSARTFKFEHTLSSLWMEAEVKQGLNIIEDGDLLTSEVRNITKK